MYAASWRQHVAHGTEAQNKSGCRMTPHEVKKEKASKNKPGEKALSGQFVL